MDIPKPKPPTPKELPRQSSKPRRPQKRKPHAPQAKNEVRVNEHLTHRPFSEALKDFKIEKESN